jgi:hypothetical protein
LILTSLLLSTAFPRAKFAFLISAVGFPAVLNGICMGELRPGHTPNSNCSSFWLVDPFKIQVAGWSLYPGLVDHQLLPALNHDQRNLLCLGSIILVVYVWYDVAQYFLHGQESCLSKSATFRLLSLQTKNPVI